MVEFQDPNKPRGMGSGNVVVAGGNSTTPGIGNVAANLGGTSNASGLGLNLVQAFGTGNGAVRDQRGVSITADRVLATAWMPK